MMSSMLMAIVMIGALYSCNEQEGTEPVLDDSELIAAIEGASNKQEVSINALPNSASVVLENEFSESFVASVKLAPELGYEVDLMLAEGADVGEASVAFFALSGRELSAEQGIFRGRDSEGRRIGRRARALRNCFDFVFPFSMILPDNSVIDLNSAEDWSLIREFYQANPDTDERPQFVFPIEVVFGEETLTINSQEEFQEAKSACEVDRRRGRCFQIEFPITFTMPDQSQITLESKEDWVLIDEWYEANPDADTRPDLNFPVNITYRNDSTVTINNQEELLAAKAECETDRRMSACFSLVFPVTFVMPDGLTEIVVESREDYREIKSWYRANPDADERPDLVFPVDIEYEDGTILTVNSEEELQAAKADCG